MAKDFLTYEEQIDHLVNDKKIACDNQSGRNILCKNGYFNLVNGYKEPFVQGKDSNNAHIYIGGTTIENLYSVKKFDEELRLCLLRYITKIEEEVRTIAGYEFDKYNDNGAVKWYSVDAYSPNANIRDVVKLISNAYHEVQALDKKAYINHYLEHYKFIPTWILTKAINFSTLINLIENSKNQVKDKICDLYCITSGGNMPDYNLLSTSLHWLRKVRNACAHNERIYDLTEKGNRTVEKYIKLLPLSYAKSNRRILDAIVYLRYYLNDDDFYEMVKQIKKLLQDLSQQISSPAFDKVRASMGIKRIEDLDILLTVSKTINYSVL